MDQYPQNQPFTQPYTYRAQPAPPPYRPLPDSPGDGKKTRARRRTRPIEIAFLAVALSFAVLLAGLVGSLAFVGGSLRGLTASPRYNNAPPRNSFAVLTIEGTIQSAGSGAFGAWEPSYNHGATLNYIKELTYNDNNNGILLYMNTGGGGVYESDEIYRALEEYKAVTSRPVWVYMGPTCASGGYYISAAAEHIVANYNTTTGSIGVYIQLTDTSGLYEKIGVKTVLVKTGENKAVGAEGTEITDAQRAVYQSIVDESYDRFVALVATGRGLAREDVLPLADGRPFTANQALENGLVDELATWDETVEAFREETGAEGFQPNFSHKTQLGSLLEVMQQTLPRSESETLLDFAKTLPSGAPLAWAPGLEW